MTLRESILQALEANSSKCLDNEGERLAVADDLEDAVGEYLASAFVDGVAIATVKVVEGAIRSGRRLRRKVRQRVGEAAARWAEQCSK